MTIDVLAEDYYEKRGIRPKGIPTGKKLLEEVGELIEAIAMYDVDPDIYRLFHLHEEIGDVAICLSYIAKSFATTVEDAIKEKTIVDTGRG